MSSDRLGLDQAGYGEPLPFPLPLPLASPLPLDAVHGWLAGCCWYGEWFLAGCECLGGAWVSLVGSSSSPESECTSTLPFPCCEGIALEVHEGCRVGW